WDTDPTWGAYVSVGNHVVELATRVPQMPELLRTGDPTVLAAFGLPPVGPAWTPSWRFVAVGSQVFLVELEAKGGQERFDNFGCARFPPLRIVVRFARPLHAPWADSRCVVQANDPAESCGTL
ncbi:MAG: hypothetical protein HOO96_31785, partial [Polyangiaceae bacterium]|nr:hypothetical protein [Polyangiaceae bacterium]